MLSTTAAGEQLAQFTPHSLTLEGNSWNDATITSFDAYDATFAVRYDVPAFGTDRKPEQIENDRAMVNVLTLGGLGLSAPEIHVVTSIDQGYIKTLRAGAAHKLSKWADKGDFSAVASTPATLHAGFNAGVYSVQHVNMQDKAIPPQPDWVNAVIAHISRGEKLFRFRHPDISTAQDLSQNLGDLYKRYDIKQMSGLIFFGHAIGALTTTKENLNQPRLED